MLYMFIPLLILCIASFAKADTKEIGGIAWYCCMVISFLVFCALAFYNEVKLCIDLSRWRHPDLSNLELLKQAVLTTLTQRFCGVENRYYLVKKGGGELTASTLADSQPLRTHKALGSRLKSLSCNPFFTAVSPSRRYSIQELQETVPIVTKQSWSLDKACCGLKNGRSEFVVGGPDAIEGGQSKSGLICSILGINLGCLVAVAWLYAAGIFTGAGAVIVIYVLIMILLGLPCSLSAYRTYKATTMPLAQDEDDNEEPVFQSWASFTVTKPKEWYCWLRLGLAFVFFFLWPMIALFANNLPKAGVIFLVTSIFSTVRLNLDAGSILRENASHLREVDFGGEEKSSQQQMIARARASQVLTKITNASLYFIAIVGFGFLAGLFVWMSGTSAGTGETYIPNTGREPIRLVDDFYYPAQNNSMLYPNCKVTNQFAFPGLDNSYALDYNFLAGMAYEPTNVSNYLVDRWFGEGVVVDDEDFVKKWRKDTGNDLEQVSFKLLYN